MTLKLKKKRANLLAGALAAFGMSAAHAEESSCAYTQKNMFAGPFSVCQEPVSAEACATIGTTDENSDAVHSNSACSAESLVGTCAIKEGDLHYYDGDAAGLKIGCGFQGGTWTTAGE